MKSYQEIIREDALSLIQGAGKLGNTLAKGTIDIHDFLSYGTEYERKKAIDNIRKMFETVIIFAEEKAERFTEIFRQLANKEIVDENDNPYIDIESEEMDSLIKGADFVLEKKWFEDADDYIEDAYINIVFDYMEKKLKLSESEKTFLYDFDTIVNETSVPAQEFDISPEDEKIFKELEKTNMTYTHSRAENIILFTFIKVYTKYHNFWDLWNQKPTPTLLFQSAISLGKLYKSPKIGGVKFILTKYIFENILKYEKNVINHYNSLTDEEKNIAGEPKVMFYWMFDKTTKEYQEFDRFVLQNEFDNETNFLRKYVICVYFYNLFKNIFEFIQSNFITSYKTKLKIIRYYDEHKVKCFDKSSMTNTITINGKAIHSNIVLAFNSTKARNKFNLDELKNEIKNDGSYDFVLDLFNLWELNGDSAKDTDLNYVRALFYPIIFNFTKSLSDIEDIYKKYNINIPNSSEKLFEDALKQIKNCLIVFVREQYLSIVLTYSDKTNGKLALRTRTNRII